MNEAVKACVEVYRARLEMLRDIAQWEVSDIPSSVSSAEVIDTFVRHVEAMFQVLANHPEVADQALRLCAITAM